MGREREREGGGEAPTDPRAAKHAAKVLANSRCPFTGNPYGPVAPAAGFQANFPGRGGGGKVSPAT